MDPDRFSEPGDRPPKGREPEPANAKRSLDRPPGERYEAPALPNAGQDSAVASLGGEAAARGLVFATLVGIAGAILDVLLAGALAVSSGLLVTAILIGRFVGLGLRLGAGRTIPPATARMAGLLLAVAAVALAQIGIWLYARSEGGVLEVVDYLAQTFGWLVPAQLAIAAIVGWLSAA